MYACQHIRQYIVVVTSTCMHVYSTVLVLVLVYLICLLLRSIYITISLIPVLYFHILYLQMSCNHPCSHRLIILITTFDLSYSFHVQCINIRVLRYYRVLRVLYSTHGYYVVPETGYYRVLQAYAAAGMNRVKFRVRLRVCTPHARYLTFLRGILIKRARASAKA